MGNQCLNVSFGKSVDDFGEEQSMQISCHCLTRHEACPHKQSVEMNGLPVHEAGYIRNDLGGFSEVKLGAVSN